MAELHSRRGGKGADDEAWKCSEASSSSAVKTLAKAFLGSINEGEIVLGKLCLSSAQRRHVEIDYLGGGRRSVVSRVAKSYTVP